MNYKIETLNDANLEDIAKLLFQYQEFYLATPNHAHNTEFLKQFIDQSKGIFFLARQDNLPIGYASIYYSYSSVSARKIAILNDLYIAPDFRGHGYGKELIDYAISYCKDKGIEQIRWCTRIDNIQAQSLYKKYKANVTDWLHYDLDIS